MEEILGFNSISKEKAKQMNAITLAFVGDAVFSLFVRVKNSLETDLKSGKLNEKTSSRVCAVAQAEVADALFPYLTEEETEIFKRGRNAKKPSKSKHSTVVQYNKSTGLEALIGYLYLTGDKVRLEYVLNFGDKNES